MNPGSPTGKPDPMLGQLLDGRYQVVRKIGEGGMGEVYAAQHVRLGRQVALKLLRHEIVSNVEAVKRFEQEAKSASSIGHKNIIGILDSGELPDGRIYLSMELLEGAPLNEMLRTLLPPDRLLNILIQTGHGLSAAHKKNIVHRDMKPENIYVTTQDGEDVPKLLDFGIAKMAAAEGNNHLTKTGTIFGTPFYMAPEQALGQNVDHRADIYAMGVIMYEVFGGVVPFAGESFMAILTQHITAEPRPVSAAAAERGRSLPPGVEEIIVRAMKKEPAERFQTMDEMVAALVAVYRGIAGAGMSSYLQAMPGSHPFPVAGQSQHLAAQSHAPSPTPPHYGATPGGPPASTPQPYAHAPGAASPFGATSAAQPSPTPPPYTPSATPAPSPYAAAPAYAAVPSPVAYPPGGSATFPAPRRRIGMWIALAVVLAGGGVGGYFAWEKMKEKDAVAKAPSGDPGGTVPAASADAGAAVVTPPPTAADAGAAVVPPPTAIDAGAAVVPPTAEVIAVMVNSEPQGADVYQGDQKLPGRTPVIVKVTVGQPIDLVLRRKRYKDVAVTLDGSVEKVSPKLERVGTAPPPDRPDRPDRPPPDRPDRPDRPPPGTPSLEERCRKNPDLPECQLE